MSHVSFLVRNAPIVPFRDHRVDNAIIDHYLRAILARFLQPAAHEIAHVHTDWTIRLGLPSVKPKSSEIFSFTIHALAAQSKVLFYFFMKKHCKVKIHFTLRLCRPLCADCRVPQAPSLAAGVSSSAEPFACLLASLRFAVRQFHAPLVP